MLTLNEKIDLAWQLRMARNIEPCLEICSELKKEIGFPPGMFSKSDLELIAKDHPWQIVSDIALLGASLTRAVKGIQESAPLVSEVEQFIHNYYFQGSYHLHFERGMNFFLVGEYAKALDLFLCCPLLERKDWKVIIAKSNALFCLENLGLPRKKMEAEVLKELDLVKTNEAIEFLKEQILAYQMRERFRQGEIKAALRLSNEKMSGQSAYINLWITSLPYHDSYKELSPQEISCLYHSRYFQYKDYRFRSLKGTLHPDDCHMDRPSELADRLYLWTWRWLTSQKSFPVEKIVRQLNYLKLHHDSFKMTLDDSLLIRNSILWLSLFDPTHSSSISEVLSHLETPAFDSAPVLGYERLFIYYLMAIRDSNEPLITDYFRELKDHPMWESQEVYFTDILKALTDPKFVLPQRLNNLLEHVRSIFPKANQMEEELVIDLIESKICGGELKKPLFSQSMCSALDVLRWVGNVTVEEFAMASFGIPSFDPIIHMPKIYNLLARLKALKISNLTFRVRSGYVIAEGTWSAVTFIRDGTLSKQLSRQPEWKSFLSAQALGREKANLKQGATSNPIVSWTGFLKRSELEELFSRPRSTTNRILNKLVNQGVVIQEGRRRTAKYRLAKISEINLEEV